MQTLYKMSVKKMTVVLFFAIAIVWGCSNNTVKNKSVRLGDFTTEKNDVEIRDTPIVSIADTVVFDEKLSSNQPPLTFTFTYNNKLYKFYAYANYLLPTKKAKEQNRKQFEIKSSLYEGLQSYDDYVDGANFVIEVPLILNKPLKILNGYIGE